MAAAAIPLDLNWLMALHSDKGLHLVTADRKAFVFLAEENPADLAQGATDTAARAYVTELVRLARIGQRLENETAAAILRRRGAGPVVQ